MSYRLFPAAGWIPSNGLVVRGSSGAVIIDTAWNPEQTAAILDWADANVGPIAALIATHAHDDRLGGLAEIDRRGIPTYALDKTVEQATRAGWPTIRHPLSSAASLDSIGVAGEIFYPGAGHTIDNATIWLEEPKILVGGCIVKSASAATLGNTKEADIEHWPLAIAELERRYPAARIVVPGHGEPGGTELLSHTRDLLRP